MNPHAVFVVAVLMSACADVGDIDFIECFGPQDTGSIQESKLDAYELRVWVGPGRELELLNSGNPTLTLQRDRPRRTSAPLVDPNRTYVHATLRLNTRLGWRIYRCSVRVQEGALRGAVIAICDGEVPPKIRDAYQAFYALPAGVHLDAQELDVEVVWFWGK